MTRFKLPVIDHRSPVGLGKPPRTRGDCINGTAQTGSLEERQHGRRQCEAFSCRHNLMTIDSSDVPGRRHHGLAPPWTLSGESTSASAASCALDVADQGEHSSAEVARIMGISKRRIEQIIARWKREHAELAEMGSAVLDED